MASQVRGEIKTWLEDRSHLPGDDFPLMFDELCLYTWSDTYPHPPLFKVVHSVKLCPD